MLTDPITDALQHIGEAIDAISLEMWRGRDLDHMERVEGVETTIAIELERVDSAIGPRGNSMFATLAENIKQCAIELYAARDALRKVRPNGCS